MRGYFFYWFSCGYRSLRSLCFCNGISFSIRKIKKIETSFLDMKEFLNSKNIICYCYKGKEKLYDNAILQTSLKGKNHFIYLIKKFENYAFIYDSSKFITYRFVKNQKLKDIWMGYQLVLKQKIKVKKIILKVFINLLTIIELQILIFILKIVLSVL